MSTKNQSYTIDEKIIKKLGVYAGTENISISRAVNKILGAFLNVETEKKVEVIQPKMTEEERLEEWEWRKRMVKEGKFPVRMGEEYPRVDIDHSRETDVYLTPDGLPSDDFSKKPSSTQTLTKKK